MRKVKQGFLLAFQSREACFVSLFFHSSETMHKVFLCSVTVYGWADAEKELERVTEIVAVIAIERIGAVVDGELRAETFAVRQISDVTERIPAHRKDFGFIERLENKFVPGFLHALPTKINRVAATLVI